MSTLISKENIRHITESLMISISDKIDNKDITEEQKEILNKSDLLQNSEGYSVLCDNGTYKDVGIDKIEETEEKTNEVIELFDINVTKEQEEKWETKSDMPTGRNFLTSSIYKDKIYVIGGYVSNGIDINECYNISTNTWGTKLNMPTKRNFLTSSIYKDKIYVIGGSYYGANRGVNECYNVSINTWETKLNMPTARSSLTSCIYKDKIYCIGGSNGANKNECYNVSTNTWETKLDNPTGRENLTSCIYEDKIYCIGGVRGGLNKNECYNISTNTWETKRDMPTGRSNLTSCIYEDKIYCIGGFGTNNECYNISTNTWETKRDMLTARDGLTSCIYEDKIYCIGGYDGSNRAKTNECYYIEKSSSSYNISLPDNLGDKLDSITTIGDGSKVLSDNGSYIDIPKGYRFMDDEEVNEIVDDILNFRK